MVVGVDGVTPLSTSTGAVPVKRGIAPAIATIDTYSVSGDEISGTRRSRSMLSAFGGSATVVSASVSGGADGRTTMKRTPSIASPKDCKAASEGKTGATATGANVVCGAVPSWQVASVSASPAVSRTRNVQFIENAGVSGTTGSELRSSRKAGQGGIFFRHAHSHPTPHTRLYRIGDLWDDSARKLAPGHPPVSGLSELPLPR